MPLAPEQTTGVGGLWACRTIVNESWLIKSANLGVSQMLFYVSLFLFCIAVSVVGLWFYRSIYDIGQAAYQVIFPRNRKQYTDEKEVELNPSLSSAVTPWGWSSAGGPRRAIPNAPLPKKEVVPTPWGWSGNGSKNETATSRLAENVSEAADSLKSMVGAGNNTRTNEPMVGWPYREEKFEFAGSEYKVTHKRKVKKYNMGGVSKPWGW